MAPMPLHSFIREIHRKSAFMEQSCNDVEAPGLLPRSHDEGLELTSEPSPPPLTEEVRVRQTEPTSSPRPLATSQHLGASRQYWRDIILGVNDGLVSTFLLVAGVTGGALTSSNILITAIAGALAGAVSMCAGEYVATKSQNEVIRGEIALEKRHIEQYFEDELAEVEALLVTIGIPREEKKLHEALLNFYRSRPQSLLQIMTALEFSVVEQEIRSPLKAGLTSCVLFILGSLPSVLPFIFSGDRPLIGLIAAAVITTVALMTVGAVKTWASRGNCLQAAAENLIIAGFGGAFAYGVGVLFDMVLHN